MALIAVWPLGKDAATKRSPNRSNETRPTVILSSNVSVKHPANEAHQTNASRDFPRKHRIRQIADKPGNSTARSPKSAMKFQNVDRSSTMSLLHRERTAFHNRTHHDATDDNRSLKSSHREAARAVE